MIEGRNEREHRAGGGQIDIAARFVWFGFEREFVVVALVDRILGEEIQRFAIPLQCFARVFRRIDLGTFAAAPEHVNVRAQFRAQVHRPHRLLQRIEAHARIVGSERPVFEDWIVKEICSGHWNFHAVIIQRLSELAYDPIAFLRRRIDRYQIVVVKVDAVSAKPA